MPRATPSKEANVDNVKREVPGHIKEGTAQQPHSHSPKYRFVFDAVGFRKWRRSVVRTDLKASTPRIPQIVRGQTS